MDSAGSTNWGQLLIYGGAALAVLGGGIGAVGNYLKDGYQRKQSSIVQEEALQRQRRLENMLQPIIELAEKKFPGLSQEKALEKLQSEIRHLRDKTSSLEKSIAPRSLSRPTTGISVLGALKTIHGLKFELMAVADLEANNLMNELKDIIMAAGLHLSKISGQVVMLEPPKGILIFVKTQQLADALKPTEAALNAAGILSKIEIHEKISDPKTVTFLIGKK